MTAAGPPDLSDWGHIHSSDQSWRKQLMGDINEAFGVPPYVRLSYDGVGAAQGLTFLAGGSGSGDLSAAVLALAVGGNLGNRGEWHRGAEVKNAGDTLGSSGAKRIEN